MLSREQAQALTRMVHLLRPAWSEEGIYAALAKCKERDAYEVTLAAVRAAADKNAKTPGIIPAKGAHWNELDPAAATQPRLSREERRKRTCDTCGGIGGCFPPAHEFIPLDHATRRATDGGSHVEQARTHIKQAVASCCRHGIDRDRGTCNDCDRTAELAQVAATRCPHHINRTRTRCVDCERAETSEESNA